MSNNNTQLPVEVVQGIKEAAKAYTHSEVKGMVDGADINLGHIKYAFEAGATEWAIWKVKYEEQKALNEYILSDYETEKNRVHALLKSNSSWAKQHQQLKERCDIIAKEHSDLNLALAAMLNGYQNLSMHQKDWFTVPKDLIDAYTKMVLEYEALAGYRNPEGENQNIQS